MHGPGPGAAFLPEVAKRNLVGLRTAETKTENFGLSVVGVEMNEP